MKVIHPTLSDGRYHKQKGVVAVCMHIYIYVCVCCCNFCAFTYDYENVYMHTCLLQMYNRFIFAYKPTLMFASSLACLQIYIYIYIIMIIIIIIINHAPTFRA